MDRHKDFWQITEDSLDKSIKVFNIDPSMKNELLNLYKILSPYKEVPETLKTLKEIKFNLAILSNGTPSLLDQLVKSNHLDNLFDDIFSIEQVGIYKPSSRVYDMPIKKYKLAILSNGTPSLLHELVNSNNLKNLFDDIFSIEEVKIYKPSSKVYEMPIKKYNIKHEEVAFLSANTWDVSGGGNYGFTSIWINRNNNIFDNLDYKPKNQITGLNQLLDIL